MDDLSVPLCELLAMDLPIGFVRGLSEIAPKLYTDAYKSVHENPAFGKPEADYLLGHQRRALFEGALRNLAAEYKLKVNMVRPEKGGCQHVRIVAGRFTLTACHVGVYGGFPEYSHSREQYSEINEHLSQGELFPKESKPEEAQIYGIIVHTEESGRKDTLRSISIGFPNSTFSDWVQVPTDLQDITDIQRLMYQEVEDLRKPIQNTDPKWKAVSDKKKVNEEDF